MLICLGADIGWYKCEEVEGKKRLVEGRGEEKERGLIKWDSNTAPVFDLRSVIQAGSQRLIRHFLVRSSS